ncbi:hypothetical protein [Aeoliella sp.]|uniref:hypothetical protein n=1 Tax=Aeoliella sp. TaxID=2795800 RepID=UPI003CCBD8B3
MRSHASSQNGESRVSWLALGIAALSFWPLLMMAVNPRAFLENVNFREGMHSILGKPETTYNLLAISAIYLLTLGSLMAMRAFTAPRISQVFLAAFESWFCAVFVVNLLVGRFDLGLQFLAIMFVACVLVDVLIEFRKRHNARLIAKALAEMNEPSEGALAA